MRSAEIEMLIVNILIAGFRGSPFPSPLPSPVGRGRIVPLFLAQILGVVAGIYSLRGWDGACSGWWRGKFEIDSGREGQLGIASARHGLAEGQKARPDFS